MSSVSFSHEDYLAKFEGEDADIAGKKQLIVLLTTDKGLCGCKCFLTSSSTVCASTAAPLLCSRELHNCPHDRAIHEQAEGQGV